MFSMSAKQPHRREEAKMITTVAEMIAKELFALHGLEGWSFKYDRAARRVGYCRYSTKTISMSRHFVNDMTEAEIREIILHEIAHALAGFKAGHGPLWRATARTLGANPSRCYDGPVKSAAPAKWVGKCGHCGHEVKMYRKPRKDRSCGKCYPHAFNYAYLIKWSQAS